ncbi:MAG: hypothetical protein Q8R12_04515 [bacterium]|nr:hypothetical protein [bacterium]
MVFIEMLGKFLDIRKLKEFEPVDWLYFALGAFTYFYLILIAIFYFFRITEFLPRAFLFFDSFDEPYLGAVAVYTILKEIRKRKGIRRHYRGGGFVILWNMVFLAALLAVWLSERYAFDGLLHIMLTNALATLIIWVGSSIHKP